VLDTTYTAKAFAAVNDFCQKCEKGAGPVLYWHTQNSVDLTNLARSVDHRLLPAPLQRFLND
jgi:hypothetical protein